MKLPADAELQALIRGVQFYRNARLLPTGQRAVELTTLKCDGSSQDTKDKCAAFARLSPPYEALESGNGQLGVFEGLTSDISVNGKQPQSNGVRCDCGTNIHPLLSVQSPRKFFGCSSSSESTQLRTLARRLFAAVGCGCR